MRAPFLRDYYRFHAHSPTFACVDFDEDEQGVSAWEIPLCPGLGHVWCPTFYSRAHIDIVDNIWKNVEEQYSLDAGRLLTKVDWSVMLRLRCDCLAMLLFLLLVYDIIF